MKTIIEMAREAGFLTVGVQEFVFAPSSFHFTEELKAFAALVRADDREACALMVVPLDESLADAIRSRGNT